MKKVLIIGPSLSMSGYGERTRSLIKDLMTLNIKPDLYITNWGNTINLPDISAGPNPVFYFSKYSEEVNYDFTLYVGMLNEKIIDAPNLGKIIALSAGIETDTMYQFENKFSRLLVSSEHSKTLINSDNVSVLPESVGFKFGDTTTVTKRFLISGAWIGGNSIGEDRKNIPLSILKLLELISKTQNPNEYEIIVHTSMGTYSEIERYEISKYLKHLKDKFENDIKLTLYHGILNETEMQELYQSCHYLFTLTHGEGFGRHIAEFMQTGGRIIAPKYSGYTDFADTEDNILLDIDMETVPKSVTNDWILPDSKWCIVTDETLSKLDLDKLDYKKSPINSIKIQNSNEKSLSILKEILFTVNS